MTAYIAEPRVEQISAASDTELASRTGQMRLLVERLGISRRQAHSLIRAYERDCADARRIGNNTRRSDADFIDWLMRQSPAQKPRSIRKYQIGEAGWRTAT